MSGAGRNASLRAALSPSRCWDGSPLHGRTILLYAEQGLGDTLQFIRYAPLVKERGGKVHCRVPAAAGAAAGHAARDRSLGAPGPAFAAV